MGCSASVEQYTAFKQRRPLTSKQFEQLIATNLAENATRTTKRTHRLKEDIGSAESDNQVILLQVTTFIFFASAYQV